MNKQEEFEGLMMKHFGKPYGDGWEGLPTPDELVTVPQLVRAEIMDAWADMQYEKMDSKVSRWQLARAWWRGFARGVSGR